MRYWKGLKVPCEPKKEWKQEFKTYNWCAIGGDKKCTGIKCADCIYSFLNITEAEQFYKECFPEKPKKLPQRDAKGRFCKKGGAEMMYYWEGLKVPVDLKREWGEWMCSEKPCPGTPAGIKCGYGKTVTCSECVYSRNNSEARRCFYEQYYGKWLTTGKSAYPKLTIEVFNRPDCPDWACFAAVDKNGEAHFYSRKPLSDSVYSCWYIAWCTDRDNLLRIESARRAVQFDASDWQHSLIERPQKELPKLTAEVFNRPDCPDWAQWAAVDRCGSAYFFSREPMSDPFVHRWLIPWYRGEDKYLAIYDTKFDASDWQNSLIERPAKELPKLTQTVFHSPDCPKEATKLKVFPANHVVALDKDDKVLSVMELQCKEGEVSRVRVAWYYDADPDVLYFKADGEKIPATAQPVRVRFFTPGYLKGRAVTNQNTGENFIIAKVEDKLVTIVGADTEKDYISMVTLVLSYRFTGTCQHCCSFEVLQ